MPRPPAPPLNVPRRTISVNEVAAQLGVSRWTVYKMVRDGVLVGIKTGPRPRDALLITVESFERLFPSQQEVS